MTDFIKFIKTDNFIVFSNIMLFLLIILIIILIIYVNKIKKEYIIFMKKIGNGNNINEMLKKYIEDVSEIKQDNSEIKAYYTKLDQDISSGLQKIGLVRYNAFQNVGSDLSFALAILDRENNGVVLNGLYGSESSNIYAKPIKNGESKYQLSEEEKEALNIASQEKVFIGKHKNNKF